MFPSAPLISLLQLAYLATTCTADLEGPPNGGPIILRRSGGFATGGEVLASPDDPGQTLSCGHGYVEFFTPWRVRRTSLVMWHSSSTQHFQNRWDGGDGFKDMFLRREYPVFLWDGPGIGRANYGCEEVTYPTCYDDIETFHSLNFGPLSTFNPSGGGVVLAQGKLWWSDSQFPVDDLAAWNQAARARYQDLNADEDLQLQSQAAAVAADSGRLGTDIVYLTHSHAGPGALMAVMKSKKENIKGVVLYETSGVVYPEGAQINTTRNPLFVPVEDFQKLAKLKTVQFVWGDHRVGNLDSRIEQFQAVTGSYIVADLINKLGGNAEVIVLPLTDVGKGNTNVPFADMNNAKVADLLDKLLEKNKLDEYASKPDLWGC